MECLFCWVFFFHKGDEEQRKQEDIYMYIPLAGKNVPFLPCLPVREKGLWVETLIYVDVSSNWHPHKGYTMYHNILADDRVTIIIARKLVWLVALSLFIVCCFALFRECNKSQEWWGGKNHLHKEVPIFSTLFPQFWFCLWS